VSGPAEDRWVRWTACFRRIDGVWLIVHDHVSVPANLEREAAVNAGISTTRTSAAPPRSGQ
jgi:hypothetical protein